MSPTVYPVKPPSRLPNACRAIPTAPRAHLPPCINARATPHDAPLRSFSHAGLLIGCSDRPRGDATPHKMRWDDRLLSKHASAPSSMAGWSLKIRFGQELMATLSSVRQLSIITIASLTGVCLYRHRLRPAVVDGAFVAQGKSASLLHVLS